MLSQQPKTQAPLSLTSADFAEVFGESLSRYVCQKISAYDFQYRVLSEVERDQALLRVLKTLLSEAIQTAGTHRLTQWTEGWKENFDFAQSPLNSLTDQTSTQIEQALRPRYFGKIDIVRWKQNWIKPLSEEFEYRMLAIIQDWLFDQYLRNASSIYEFGCGTGHNLLRARKVNSTAHLYGLDWASSSQKILDHLRLSGQESKIFGHPFDFFNPSENFALAPNSVVYTVAALEQVGENFKPFFHYILKSKPSLVLHIEPIAELLDPTHLLDFLSIQYFEKRHYLKGYFDFLKQQEQMGQISIERAQRTYIGSFFIDGYSIIVWKPLN